MSSLQPQFTREPALSVTTVPNPAKQAKIAEIAYLEAIQKDTKLIAERLVESDNALAVYEGLRLAESVSDNNLFVGFEMQSVNGETFTGRGNLADITSRLSRFYLQRSAKENRKQIAECLKDIKPRSDERWRFITPTMPRLSGLSLAQTAKVYDDALVNLRNDKQFWKKFRAVVRSREFTLGNKAEREKEERAWKREDGYHYHSHWIVCSKWIENRKGRDREFAEKWKIALEKSAEQNGVVLEFNTDDGLPVVDVRLVVDRRGVDNDTEISLEKAIQETAKYITKQDTFLELPIDEVIEISEFLKGKRMIEPLGEANKREGSKREKRNTQADVSESAGAEISFKEHADVEQDTYVLESPTIEKNNSLKIKCLALIQEGRIGEAKLAIHFAFERKRQFRRRQLALLYETATFMSLDGETWCNADYSFDDFARKF